MNDITVHFKGDGRREEEGGVRRKGARRGSKMQPLRQKVRRKCDPLGRNRAESISGRGQTCDPLGRNARRIEAKGGVRLVLRDRPKYDLLGRNTTSGSKMRPLRQKVRRKCDPLGGNRAESTWGGSKMLPLRQKVRQKCHPLGRNGGKKPSGRGWTRVGRRERRAGENLVSSENHQRIADICNIHGLTRLEPRWGRRIYGLPPLPPTHRGMV